MSNYEANTPEIATDPVIDSPNPAPAQAPAPEPAPAEDATPAEVAEPVIDTTSARDAIAARFRAQRDSEAAALEGVAEDPAPGQPAPAREEPPVDEERYRIKVRGNEFMLNRDELIKTAGLRPEDADGIPMPALVRAAQINAAAEDYLAEARTVHRTGRTAAAPGEGTPPSENAEPALDAPATSRGPSDPALLAAAAKIQYGEPEEAAAALDEVLEARLERLRTAEREREFQEQTQKAVEEFAKSNQDLFADTTVTDFLYVNAMHEIKKDLIRLGANPDDVNEAVTDPAKAVEAYTIARQKGLGVRDPHEVLSAAASVVRARIGTAKEQSAPPSRQELKRALPAQPRPATVPSVATQPPPQPRSPSSVILGMRRARGQSV